MTAFAHPNFRKSALQGRSLLDELLILCARIGYNP